MAKATGIKLIANNKKAFHDYFIEDTYEAGISLAGTEVKSLRMGKCSVKESFIRVEKGEVYIYGMHISPYDHGNIFNRDPMRREISLTRIRCVSGSFSFTDMRSTRSKGNFRKKVSRWFPSRCISRAAW